MAEGVVRKVSIPIVKMMLEATVEQFFQRDILIQSRLSYLEALDEVVSILVNGIVVPEAAGINTWQCRKVAGEGRTWRTEYI